MRFLNHEIEHELKTRGAKFVRFVDVSHLSGKQNRGLPCAIVFALPLSAGYLREVAGTPDYVAARIADNYRFDDDEYSLTEIRAGKVADALAGFLTGKSYQAISQSDESLLAESVFDAGTHESVLPHKTVALLGGMGWIGKNNLLITPGYGAAQCLGTVLTDAPLRTTRHEPLSPRCGACTVCIDICERHVLRGRLWAPTVAREEIVDVYGCSTCLKCLVHCPHTRQYAGTVCQKSGGE